ncbi:MAG: ferritin [Bacteroidota bacterium]
MLSKTIQNALNEQINKEMYSSYLYMSMATHCVEHNHLGFASWLRVQSREEWSHAMKLYNYIHNDGGHVELDTIEKPAVKFKSPKDIFVQVLAHEQTVTASITKLYELAMKEKNYPTQILLQWFITEQVEEENTAKMILDKLTLIGENVPGLLYLDKELGKRAAK